MPRRILIKGAPAAGKSTLAAQLAERLALPHLELDALHHGPNWKPATAAELLERVQAALDDDRGWIVDGNYESKLGNLLLDRAEIIVWLDLPLKTKLLRLTQRTALRMARNEALWNGNKESLKGALWGRDALFPWTIRSHFHHRRSWPQSLAGKTVIRLRSPHEVAAWLHEFCEQR